MLLLTKAVFAIMIGFLSSTVLGLFLIPLLKKIHLGQKISVFVGEAHRKKEGTPTMGGLIFIVPTVLSTLALIVTDKVSYTSNIGIVLLVFIGYACIGFFLIAYCKSCERRPCGKWSKYDLFASRIINDYFYFLKF